jgi:acyl carrier protein
MPPDKHQSLEQLCTLVADALKVSPEAVHRGTRSSNLPQWNSLGHLQVILAVETHFGVRFRTAEMLALDSIEALARRLSLVPGAGPAATERSQ